MAEDNGSTLDPLTELSGKQQSLEAQIAKLTELVTKQAEVNAQLMKSNGALVAQINAQAPAQAPAQENPTREELARRAQDLAHETMLRKLGIETKKE